MFRLFVAAALFFFSSTTGHEDSSASGASGGDASDSGGRSSGSGGSSGSSDTTKFNKKRTYYEILEVNRKSTDKEIKEAYRRLAKKYHPDRNLDDTEAEARFKEIQEAHSTLMDKWKRALYDQDLQFGEFGSGATQDQEKEKWTEHWDRETPDEREARRDRYRRYAAGERNDLPPAPFPLQWTLPIFFAISGSIFYVCVKAPEWIDDQDEATFNDPAYDDRTIPLVRAFHDPILNRWERLPEGTEPPKPADLYAHYRRTKPALLEGLDLRLLPKVALTVLMVPRTEAVRAIQRTPRQAATA